MTEPPFDRAPHEADAEATGDGTGDDAARRLAEVMQRVTPSAPVSTDRPDRIRRRDRRAVRFQAAGVVCAAAVVTVGILVVPHYIGASPALRAARGTTYVGLTPLPSYAGGSASASTGGSAPGRLSLKSPLACRPGGRAQPPATVLIHGEVPLGAIAAKACPVSTRVNDIGPGYRRWISPTGNLTTGLAKLIAVIDSRRPLTRGVACTADGSLIGYTVSFEYPDGAIARVSGNLGGCGTVRRSGTSPVYTYGAERVFDSYLDAVSAQRAAELSDQGRGEYLHLNAGLACPSSAWRQASSPLPKDDELSLHDVLVCEYAQTMAGKLLRSATLTAGQAKLLSRDYRANADHGVHQQCAPPTPAIAILGESQWGDRVMLSGNCDAYLRVAGYDGDGLWNPSPQVQKIIRQALAHGNPGGQ